MLRDYANKASTNIPPNIKFIQSYLRKMNFFLTPRGIKKASYAFRLKYDAVERPEYGYCIYEAAKLAKTLGYSKISVIELGVAYGDGLVNIEEHVLEVEKEVGIKIEIFGFDSGIGLPKPEDYKDLPFLWKETQYAMNQEKVQKRIKRAKLIIGDIKETVNTFFEDYNPAPIGCIFFDFDFYSSTINAFNLFNTEEKNYLPRVNCYFDDIIGTNEFVGELRAIDNFNANHENKKIAKIFGFSKTRIIPSTWNEQIFLFHDFLHSKYNDFVGLDSSGNEASV
tara:strand:+ start:1586 stop:2428 length:843 start_codon:yes stop_codon:yes gene_type:complete